MLTGADTWVECAVDTDLGLTDKAFLFRDWVPCLTRVGSVSSNGCSGSDSSSETMTRFKGACEIATPGFLRLTSLFTNHTN